MGLVMTLSPMTSKADVDERIVVVTVQREEAVVNKSLMPPGDNDEEQVLDAAEKNAVKLR